MQTLYFWKSWLPVYRRLLMGCLLLVLMALTFLWFSNLEAPSPVIKAEHFQDIENITIPIHTFYLGTHPLAVSADTYIVLEHVLGGALTPNIFGGYLFLFLFAASVVVLLSILTTLSRFWFFAGMGLLILVIVSLRLDALLVGGSSGQLVPVIVLLLYGLAGYYYQFLRSSATFVNRIWLFAGITVLTGLVLAYFSGVSRPFFWISAHAILPAIVLTVMLIFTVAHEILAAFITLLTQGRQPTRSLQHFLIVSAIYLINLGLMYADKKHMIEWNFLPFSFFLLITISVILGFWGFRQREVLYENILTANPFGTYLYLALSVVGLGTMAFVVSSANDPAVHFVQDTILYSHLGYGLIFLVYVIVNFISLLGNNKAVHLIMYKPTTMPYFTFRFAGLIATFAFFAYSNWRVSLNQIYAGHYNAVGDYYVAQDSTSDAESYFQRSILYANRNYHAHYALSQMLATRWEFEKEKTELARLAHTRPLDLAYLNQARLYEVSQSWQEASQILHDGLKDFSGNGLLQNALGLVYAKMENRDSAVMMINAARSSGTSREAAETNLMGISAHFRVTLPADSLYGLFSADNAGVLTNALALAAFQKKTLSRQVSIPTDTTLTLYSATAINNMLIQRLGQADTSQFAQIMSLANRPVNARFKNILLAALAQTYYQSGEINRAFRLMHEAAFIGQLPPYYQVLGLWSLEQGAPETALHFIDQALSKNYSEALPLRALSLTENGEIPDALLVWDSLAKSPDHAVQREAERMRKILTFTPAEALGLTPQDQYEFSRLRFTVAQQEDFEKFINAISDSESKARAIVDRAAKLEEADEPSLAIHTLALAKGVRFSDKRLLNAGQHIHVRCLASLGKWKEVGQQIQSGITFEGSWQTEKLLFETLIAEQEGKPNPKNFAQLGTVNPFFEDAVVEAARFAALQDSNRLKAYDILIQALDRNPNSVKLLKAHFVQAVRLEFDDVAKESLDKLHRLLTKEAFVAFAKQYPDIFEVVQN